jgi:hypothetical protein
VKKAVGTVVPFVVLLAAGCLGNSAASAPSTGTVPTHAASAAEPQGLSIGPHPVVDARTWDRLLAEWRVAVSTAQVVYGPAGGIGFLPPRRLASTLHRANPAIPVIPLTSGYVHLVAVDRHAPRFTFGSLLRGGL